MKLDQLDQIIRAVCPIDGISTDGAIAFKAEATQQQRDAATALMAQYIGSLDDIAATDYGTINAKALIRRRADDLQQQGKLYDALLLFKTIGE